MLKLTAAVTRPPPAVRGDEAVVGHRALGDDEVIEDVIHDVNERNASFVFRQAGGASLRPGTLQRLCRDAMAAGQHLLLATSSYIDCGRDYLGEAENQQWSFYNLV
ncbi:hypothetical protein ABZ372_32400 [Streptomyces sp. NPDC005921]